MNRRIPGCRRRPALHDAGMALATLLLTGSAWADPPARAGRMAWVGGDVSLSTEPGAALNWPVTSGNVLSTGPSGRAEVAVGSTAIDLDVASASGSPASDAAAAAHHASGAAGPCASRESAPIGA